MRAYCPGEEHPALHGIPAETIAELCRVHITTARRWKRGEEPPYTALKLIELLTTGNLGVIDLRWQGWRLHHGSLISPDGMDFSPGDIHAMTFLRQLIASYQSAQRLPRQADWVTERWEPSNELDANTA